MKKLFVLFFASVMFFFITMQQTVKAQQLVIENSNWNRNGPFCAQVKSLAIAPSNSNVLYLGTLATGLYKSIDGGNTWTYCSVDNLPRFEDTLNNSPGTPCWWWGDFYPIEAIAVNPQNENNLWVGTLKRGLFESTNGGDTWQKANETLPDTLDVNVIDVNPQNSNDILLGTGKYFSANSPHNGGIYRTLNGGATWFLIEELPHGSTYHVSDIIRDPTDNNHIIVSISSVGEPGFSWGLMESSDNGTTWQELSANIFTFRNLLFNPTNNQEMWSIVLTGYGDYLLMKSVDGGANWNLYDGFEDPYKWTTGLYSDNDFNLYIKRLSDASDFSFNILKSSNNGDSWVGVDKLNDKVYYGWDNFKNNLQADYSNPQKVYFGNDYGFFLTQNGGENLQAGNTNLINSYILDIESYSKNNSTIYAAGHYQGLWKSTDAGESWSNVIRENIKVVKCDPNSPDTLYFGGRDLWRSFNGGQTYEKIAGPLYSTLRDIVINPKKNNILYYKMDRGGTHIFKSIDFGTSWSEVLTCSDNDTYREMAIDPSKPDTLYVGQYRTLNGGANWEQLFNKKIVAVHPENSNVLYAVDGEFHYDHTRLEVSYDWGNTFEVIAEYNNGPFPGENIYCLRFDKNNPDYLFYSTRNTNVYYSLNAGQNWQQLQGNYKRVTDIIPIVQENLVYLATYGDGVWVSDTLQTSITDHRSSTEQDKLKTIPNPFTTKTTIEFEVERPGNVSISIYNMQGQLINTLLNEQKAKGRYNIIWGGEDFSRKEGKPGLYFVLLNSGRKSYTHKVILLK